MEAETHSTPKKRRSDSEPNQHIFGGKNSPHTIFLVSEDSKRFLSSKNSASDVPFVLNEAWELNLLAETTFTLAACCNVVAVLCIVAVALRSKETWLGGFHATALVGCEHFFSPEN